MCTSFPRMREPMLSVPSMGYRIRGKSFLRGRNDVLKLGVDAFDLGMQLVQA